MRERYDEETMFKVLNAMREVGITRDQAQDAINTMHNDGILFRERAKNNDVHKSRAPNPW